MPPPLPPFPSLSLPLIRLPHVSDFPREGAPLLSSISPLPYPFASVVPSFICFSPLMLYLLLSSLLFNATLSYPFLGVLPLLSNTISSLISFLLLFPLLSYISPLSTPPTSVTLSLIQYISLSYLFVPSLIPFFHQ